MGKRTRRKKNPPSVKRARVEGLAPKARAVAHATNTAQQPGPPRVGQPPLEKLWLALRSPWRLGIVSLAVTALVIGGAIWWVRRRPAPSSTAPAAVTTPAAPNAAAGTATDAAAPTPHTGPAKGSTTLTAPTTAQIEAARQAGAVSYVLETSRGSITIDLRGDLMPLTVANFVQLAQAGFYDGLTFHRVEDWVVQGGDPAGDGSGGPGYTIRLETNPALLNRTGAIAMARTFEPDSAGSQFYILKKDADWLDGEYAVFGNVTAGMDVVNKLQIGDQILSVRPASTPASPTGTGVASSSTDGVPVTDPQAVQ